MRYLVDRDEILKEKFSYGYKVKDNDRGSLDTHTTYAVTEESILNAPVVEERKHGHWIIKNPLLGYGGEFVCSECGSIDRDIGIPKFCRICGAKMDEEVKQ